MDNVGMFVLLIIFATLVVCALVYYIYTRSQYAEKEENFLEKEATAELPRDVDEEDEEVLDQLGVSLALPEDGAAQTGLSMGAAGPARKTPIKLRKRESFNVSVLDTSHTDEIAQEDAEEIERNSSDIVVVGLPHDSRRRLSDVNEIDAAEAKAIAMQVLGEENTTEITITIGTDSDNDEDEEELPAIVEEEAEEDAEPEAEEAEEAEPEPEPEVAAAEPAEEVAEEVAEEPTGDEAV